MIKRGLLALAILTSPLYSEQFIVTYEATSKNGILQNEKYFISSVMVYTPTWSSERYCFIDNEFPELSLAGVLKNSKDSVLECLFRFGVKLRSYELKQGENISSTAILSIPPTPINAEFKDDFVTITLIR